MKPTDPPARLVRFSSAAAGLLLGAHSLAAQTNLNVPAGTSLTLNESAAYQNVTVGSGATLKTIDANSGGGGDHAITLTFAAESAGTIQNDGVIEFAGNDQGNTTVFANPVTLSGSGTLELLNTYGFNDASVQGPGTVTQAAGHTLIGGGGDTGSTGPSFSVPLVNYGLVTTSNIGLVLNGSSVVNNGSFSASNGSALRLDALTLDNTNGTITVGDANSVVLIENGIQVTGGTLQSTVPGTIGNDYGVFRLQGGASLANLTLAANAGVKVEDTGTLAGTITNNGFLFVPGNVSLNLAGDVTLAGTGTLNLSGHLEGANNATLTINPGQELQLSGNANTSGIPDIVDASVVNNGTLADTYQAGTINSPTLTNNGVIAASNGAVLYLTGPALNNTNGTITAAASSLVILNGVTVTGGTLSSVNDTGSDFDNGGYFRDDGPSTLNNVTFAASSAFAVGNPLTIVGTLTNNGYFFIQGFNFNTGLTGSLTLSADATLAGTGIARLAGGEIDATNNATLTVAAGATIAGGSGTINASLTNNGTVESVYQAVTINSPTFTNNGLLAADNNGSVSVSGSTNFTNFNSGSVSARRVAPTSRQASARFKKQDAGGGTLSGGTYTVTDQGNGATLDFGGRSVAVNAAAVTLSGPNSNFNAINGLADNQGSLSLFAQRIFSTVGALSNEGTIALDAGSTLQVNGSFTASNTAELKVTVGGTASRGAGSSGVLQASGAVVLGGTLAVTLAPGAAMPNASDSISFLSAGAGITGSFSNVPSGTRIATTDGQGSFVINYGANSNLLTVSDFTASGTSTTPAFFMGETALSNGVYYLAFASGNYFGYYSFLSNPAYIYHFDLGYEYIFDAADGKSGVYFYDFKSNTFFYTSPTFPFPYLYDFTLNSVLYYYPDPNNAGHYNTEGIRYFYDFNTQQIITK